MLVDQLTALGEARALADLLSEQIKTAEAPHLAAAAAASAALRAQSEQVGAALAVLEPLCRAEWTRLNDARKAALKRGEECPAVAVPAGCIVQERPHTVIDDADQIPRELCAPVAGKVSAALKLGACPGAHVEKRPVFCFKEPKK